MAPPSDSSQASMMQMHHRMQAMQQQMMQMHGQRASEAGPSALLLGSVADLGLTEEQQSRLQEALERARSEALQALTPEQRQKLEEAPTMGSMCQQARPSAGGGG
jgi:predicted exporter